MMMKEMRSDDPKQQQQKQPISYNKKHVVNHHHVVVVVVKFGISFLLVGFLFRSLFFLLSFDYSTSIWWFPPPHTTTSQLVVQTTKDSDLPPSPLPPSPSSSSSSSSSSSLPVIIPGEDQSSNISTAGKESSMITISNVAAEEAAAAAAAAAAAKCDIFVGDWVPDPSGPVYTNESCLLNIEAHQNCIKNGRPDTGFLYWRWSPRGCDLPRFDPHRFLDMVKDKSWAFIGDSISRNHVQSLLCILSQVEEAVEVYHDEEYKSKRWHFRDHNFTLSVIWTPFLIKADIFEDINGISSSSEEIQLHLDKLDTNWTDPFEGFDYVVIAGGKWFLKTAIYHENGTATGCHYCPPAAGKKKNLTELGFDYAYRKALKLVLEFVITHSKHGALVFFRTATPDHFENGEWFSGGTCNRTVPFKEGEIEMRDVDVILRNIELEELDKVKVGSRRDQSAGGVMLKLLDTTRLSLLRPDGHPGPYRQNQPPTFAKQQEEDDNDVKVVQIINDCLHWCLPGPIDSWNDLIMMEMMMMNSQ